MVRTRHAAQWTTLLSMACLSACTTCDDGITGSDGVASISVAPAAASLAALGQTVQLTATARSSSGNVVTGLRYTWATSDGAVAMVGGSGLVTAAGNGSATITASAEGASGTASIVVQQQAAAISVTPEAVVLRAIGEVARFRATVTDANQREMSGPVQWTSSNQAVASVSEDGLARATGAGTALVSARAGSVTANASVVVSLVPTNADVTAGFDHSCALTTMGEAYCWGGNGTGQLGDGSTTRRLQPVRVQGGHRFVSISAGHGHTCAVTAEGDGYCWGNSDRGQVGDGGLGQRLAPSRVVGALTFAAIEAGRAHTCGITTAGVVWCWGWGSNGEMGHGQTATRVAPDSVHGGGRYTTVKGTAHTICAIRSSGSTECWGRNNTGQVGDGTTTCTSLSASCFHERALPTRVQTAATFVSASSGARIVNGFGGGTSCAVTASGAGYCWGQNSSGQIGDGTLTQRLVPTGLFGNHVWRMIDVGSATTCGVTAGDTGFCWGFNGNGILGDGTTINRLIPTALAGGLALSRISVGFDHACAVTISADVYCWGSNPNGELGDGTTNPRATPVRVLFP